MWNKINVCIEIAFNIVRLVVLVIRLFKYWDFDTEKYFDILQTKTLPTAYISRVRRVCNYVLRGIRTHDRWLRRPLLYPAELSGLNVQQSCTQQNLLYDFIG